LKKIAQLTEQHKKTKLDNNTGDKTKQIIPKEAEADLSSEGEDEDADEKDADGDVKMEEKKGKKQFPSKNTLSK